MGVTARDEEKMVGPGRDTSTWGRLRFKWLRRYLDTTSLSIMRDFPALTRTIYVPLGRLPTSIGMLIRPPSRGPISMMRSVRPCMSQTWTRISDRFDRVKETDAN